MKKLSFILLLITISIVSFSQDIVKSQQMSVEFGRVVHSNSKNETNYYWFKQPGYNIQNVHLNGWQLKFSIPSNYKRIDFDFGAIYESSGNLGSVGWQSGYNNSFDHLINGGGVFGGISTNIGTENIGIKVDLSVGVFSYKEYIAIFNNVVQPYIDILDKRVSNGFGSTSSIGLYMKIWKIEICPSLQVIYSGGDQAGFLFTGFVLPIAYHFE